jgi:hypothetical protein
VVAEQTLVVYHRTVNDRNSRNKRKEADRL